MNYRFFLFLPFILLSVLFISCKKDGQVVATLEEKPLTSGNVVFKFNATANGKPLLATTIYTNQSEEKYTVSKFNYYISNLVFKKDDGSVYAVPESYYLIRHLDAIDSFMVNSVPPGNYTSVQYLIGVDSLRNVSGIQGGALDPAHNMFWDWNTGYIFFKMEGIYSSLNKPFGSGFTMHIGGFSGPNSCLQYSTLNFPTPLVPGNDHVSKIHVNTRVDEVFINPEEIGFDVYMASMTEKMFQSVSINYKDMFVVTKVEN